MALPQKQQTQGSGVQTVSETYFKANLAGKTINECIEDGTIDEETLDVENMFRKHSKHDIYYFVFGDKAVRISDNLLDAGIEIMDNVGACVFRDGISTIEGEGKGKYFMRLAMPGNGLDLDEEEAYGIQPAKVEKAAPKTNKPSRK